MFRTRPDYVIRNGESAVQFFDRCINGLEEIAQKHKGDKIVVVTHMGVLECVFKHALAIQLEARRRFKVREASLNRFTFKKGQWTLETWGDVSHLK